MKEECTGFQSDIGGPPLAISTPHVMLTPQTTPQHFYHDDGVMGSWNGSEARFSNLHRNNHSLALDGLLESYIGTI